MAEAGADKTPRVDHLLRTRCSSVIDVSDAAGPVMIHGDAALVAGQRRIGPDRHDLSEDRHGDLGRRLAAQIQPDRSVKSVDLRFRKIKQP